MKQELLLNILKIINLKKINKKYPAGCSDDNLSLCKDNTKNLGYNIYKNFQEIKYKEESEGLIVKTISNGTSEIFLNSESYESIKNWIKTA